MKILQVLVLVLGLFVFADAQVDCVVSNKVVVRDYDNNLVKNPKLEILKVEKNFNRVFAFAPHKIENDNNFFISELGQFNSQSGKVFSVSDSFRLKVTADNFKVYEQSIKFDRCEAQEVTVVLEQINQKIKLTGVIYDPNGAIVVGANVTATNKDNTVFKTKSDDDGVFALSLLPSTYELKFGYAGFKKYTISGFRVVNSTYGKQNQDIVLELGTCSDCDWIASTPLTKLKK